MFGVVLTPTLQVICDISYYLLEKKSLICQNTLGQCILPPLRSSATMSNHGMGTESFVCLFTVVLIFFFNFFFCVFVFLSHYGVTRTVLVVCEQVFHRTASASQGREVLRVYKNR